MARPVYPLPPEPEPFAAQCCGNCRHFWRAKPDDKQGQCRAMPPHVIVVTGQANQPQMQGGKLVAGPVKIVNQIQAIFPPMAENDPGCSGFSVAEMRKQNLI